MADEFGAAQPIADWVKKYVVTPTETFETVMGKLPPHDKIDPSWHDNMVKAANRSFLPIQKRKLGGKRKTSSTKKRKRVARKR